MFCKLDVTRFRFSVKVLKLAKELKRGTIEHILEMDVAELGLRFLLGDLPGKVSERP